MASNVTDEVDADTAWAFIVQIAVETEGTEVALKFATEKGSGLAAAGIAGLLRAHEDEVGVGTGASCENRGRHGD